jgi:hypothetical protein
MKLQKNQTDFFAVAAGYLFDKTQIFTWISVDPSSLQPNYVSNTDTEIARLSLFISF